MKSIKEKVDLMTDDWVKTPEGNYRVLGVLNDVVYTDFRNDERDGMAFSDELVEPISLTPEALKRNGFTCDENIAKLVERDEHYTPKTYDKGGWNIPDVKYWLDVELPKEIEL